MSQQEKNQPSKPILKNQLISNEAESMFEDKYRKLESSTVVTNMSSSYTKRYITTTAKTPFTAVAGTEINASQTVETKAMLGSLQIKEILKEKEPEIWDGPLNRYNTYTSNKTPKECVKVITEALDRLEGEKLVDWEIEAYNVCGRMYHRYDMSEYMINVYASNDNQYKSVIEIRRSSGDTFVHDEFFRRISKSLEEASVLEHKEEECEMNFDFSLALEPLSLDLEMLNSDLLKDPIALSSSSSQIYADISNDVDYANGNDNGYGAGDDGGDGLIKEKKNGNGKDDTNSNDNANTMSTHKWGEELLEVVTDRSSYREIFQHSSGVLCQELETNPQMLQYIATQTNIIQRLMKPLTEDLYDTLIIRNILQVVKQLLQYENPRVSLYANCAKDIRDLQEKWTIGAQHQAINMRFGRSQQVTRVCSECLDVLQKRF